MSKTDIWMPLYWADLLADTQHLSRGDLGSYMLLIGSYWRRGGPLVDDDEELSRMARCDAADWPKTRQKLVAMFQVKEGYWWHKRVEEELAKARHNRELASVKGKTGAEKRWGKNGCGYAPAIAAAMPVPMAGAIPNDSSSPSSSPSPIEAKLLEPEAHIPTEEEVLQCASMRGVMEEVARKFFMHYEGKRLWLNQHGRLINWQLMLTEWQQRERQMPTKEAAPINGTKPKSVYELTKIIEAKESLAKSIRNKHTYEAASGVEWSNQEKRQEYRTLKAEIKTLTEQLAKG